MAENTFFDVGNTLLGGLPLALRSRLSSRLEAVTLNAGETLHAPYSTQRFGYFPESATVSLMHHMQNGASTEVAVTGREGMVGVALVLGQASLQCSTVVQTSGLAWRMRISDLRSVFLQDALFRDALMVYALTLMQQISQTAACNRLHNVDQRLSRWLLICQDRAGSNIVETTHALASALLGVRREAISISAGRLQRHGLIRCTRGRLVIVDRNGLIDHACECYTQQLAPAPQRQAAYA